MVQRLYLSDAFGWETKSIDKVGISQLREKKLMVRGCAKAQLKNQPSVIGNLIKVAGYIPVLNIITGVFVIYASSTSKNHDLRRPHHKEFWIARGVAMILCGPLLIPVDGIKTIYDRIIAAVYAKKHPALMAEFNCPHKHVQDKKGQFSCKVE